VKPRSLKREKVDNSNVTKDITCYLGTPQSQSEIRHRVVIFQDDHGNEIRVATNLMHLSAEQIAKMYKARWGIEVFFRWIKQNLNVPILFGTTKNAVFNQLFAALMTYVVLKMAVRPFQITHHRLQIHATHPIQRTSTRESVAG
jgi:IS4 transposase